MTVFRKFKENPHINISEVEDIWFTACWTWAQIYSREFLNVNQVRYSSNRFLEDLAFFAKAVVCAKDISILDEPLYTYRKELSKKNINYSKYYADVLSTKKQAYDFVKEYGNRNILNNFIVYQIDSDIHWLRTFSKQNKKIIKDVLKGKVVAFTGKPDTMTKKKFMELVVSYGGIVAKDYNHRIDIFVEFTNPQKKHLELIEKLNEIKEIKICNERQFMEIINDDK